MTGGATRVPAAAGSRDLATLDPCHRLLFCLSLCVCAILTCPPSAHADSAPTLAVGNGGLNGVNSYATKPEDLDPDLRFDALEELTLDDDARV
jgi:hypothetical protein